MSILQIENLGISFGGLKALQDVSFNVGPGEVFALIGPNGAGKTTLFNVISGLYAAREGRIVLDGEDVSRFRAHKLARRGLSRTFQNLQIFFRMSAVENVMVGCHLRQDHNVLAHCLTLPSVLRQNRSVRDTAEALLVDFGLGEVADRPAGTLPYGALRRLEMARALATGPKVLLLDEPAAGCNPVETSEINAAIRKIVAGGTTVVFVEHDMRMVMSIADRIHVLHQGRTLAEGTAAEIRADPRVIGAYLGAQGVREVTDAGG